MKATRESDANGNDGDTERTLEIEATRVTDDTSVRTRIEATNPEKANRIDDERAFGEFTGGSCVFGLSGA